MADYGEGTASIQQPESDKPPKRFNLLIKLRPAEALNRQSLNRCRKVQCRKSVPQILNLTDFDSGSRWVVQ
jgi:hypothetical protein